MPTKYIAFDLDGTLVDADELHFVALNTALSVCGDAAVISRDEHLHVFKGLPTRQKLAMLVEMGRISVDQVPVVSQIKQTETLKAIDRMLKPDHDKHVLLQTLRQTGWHMCVCSNAVRLSVRAMLLATGLITYFEFFLSNQDATPKPHPDIYLKAARLFEITPESLVVVEDAEPGKEAARAAHCQLVSITGPADATVALLSSIYAAGGLTYASHSSDGGTRSSICRSWISG